MRFEVTSPLALLLAGLALGPAQAQQPQLWIDQFGTSAVDHAWSAASDGAGGVYLGGYTRGDLAGTQQGLADIWLSRHDAAGNPLWSRQLGTPGWDQASAVAADGGTGVFVGGYTYGALTGTNLGECDAWLARYDAWGNLLWMRQLGTASFDFITAAAPDGAGGLFAAGHTFGDLAGANAGHYDAWLARFDGAGNALWTRQLGSASEDHARALAPDGAGGVFVAGDTFASLAGPHQGGYDAWLARFDGSGSLAWALQFGSGADDEFSAAATDGVGGVYLSGFTGGSLGGTNAGGLDALLLRYDGSGNALWARQFGTTVQDRFLGAAPDGMGGVYASGFTDDFQIGWGAGGTDAVLARYDALGNEVWLEKVGSNSTEWSTAAAADGTGGVFLCGFTGGAMSGPNLGLEDAWVARYGGACESGQAYCASMVSSNLCAPTMGAVGAPSSSQAAGYSLGATGLEVGQNGLLFFGTTGKANTPFLGGTLCVQAPLYRMGVKNTGGGTDCTGSLSYTLADLMAHSQAGPLVVPGAKLYAQVWTRDPSAPTTVNLSNGLELLVCP